MQKIQTQEKIQENPSKKKRYANYTRKKWAVLNRNELINVESELYKGINNDKPKILNYVENAQNMVAMT